MYVEMEVKLQPILLSALDASKWSSSRPGRFTPKEVADKY
jgi:hypothetical protein